MTRHTLIALCFGLGALGWQTAAAQVPERGERRAARRARPAGEARVDVDALLERFDRDGDRKLDRAELARLLRAVAARRDAPGGDRRSADGAAPRVRRRGVPEDPAPGERPKTRERDRRGERAPLDRAAILKRFDANGNGKLDPEERAKALAEMRRGGRRGAADPAPVRRRAGRAQRKRSDF